MVSIRHFAAFIVLAVLAACWGGPEGPPRPTFSMNGEPLVPPQWPQKCEDAVDLWFDKLDARHTGGVTLAELTADAERQYRLMDLRHDGKVTAEELSKYRLKIMGGHYLSVSTPGQRIGMGRGSDDEARPGDRLDEPADDDRPHKRHGEEDRPVDAYAALVSDQPDPVMSADNDLDGSVTWDEFRALVAQNFAELDQDHTGAITKPEVEQTCSRK